MCIHAFTSVYMYIHALCTHVCIYMSTYIVYTFAKMYDFLERNCLRMAFHSLFHPDAS